MQVKIVNHLLKPNFLEYTLSIRTHPPSEKAQFLLRFSELTPLHKKISNYSQKIPNLPPKWQFYGKSLEEIRKRELLIEEYLNKMLSFSDRNIQEIFENFIKDKLCGISAKERVFQKTKSVYEEILYKTEEITVKKNIRKKPEGIKETTIFSGLEYVIERENRHDSLDFRNYNDNIFDIPFKKKRITSNSNKKNIEKGFFNNFFGCCNYH